MAYNNNSPRAEYTASASQTVFPFLFKIFTSSDIKVYQTPVGQDPDDVADLLTLTTDYTVTINGDAGGEITLVTGATNGDKITLLRNLDITRNIEYQSQGDLTADTLNLDQEYQTYLIADREAIGERYIKLSENAQGVDATLPAPVSDAYFKWSADASSIVNDTTIPDAVTTSAANAVAAAASATQAQLYEWEAEAERLTADSYATEAEDTFVNLVTSDGDGTFTYTPTTEYSSLHWATKAATFNPALYALLTGATFTGQVKGITPVADEDLTRKDYVDAEITSAVGEFTGLLSTDSFLHIQDQKPSGTDGGSSLSGVNTRVLNTILTNNISGASLASNQITLPAGTYFIQGETACFKGNGLKPFLRNITDSTDDIVGESSYASNTAGNFTKSSFSGNVTIASAKVFEFRQYIGTALATNGLGLAIATGRVEIYTDIKIWKVG